MSVDLAALFPECHAIDIEENPLMQERIFEKMEEIRHGGARAVPPPPPVHFLRGGRARSPPPPTAEKPRKRRRRQREPTPTRPPPTHSFRDPTASELRRFLILPKYDELSM